MSAAPKTPIYHDELIAWHNQRLWWLLCGSGAVIVALVVTLGIMTLRPHAAPYVIAVDKQGQPIGTILPFSENDPVSDSMLRYALGEYVRNAFSVTRDFDENQYRMGEAYHASTGQATQALTAYYRGNHDARNPLFVFKKYWQNVRIVRTLRLPTKDAFQVDYIIERHDSDHTQDGVQTAWRATVHIVRAKPTDQNPLGLWVTDLDAEAEEK